VLARVKTITDTAQVTVDDDQIDRLVSLPSYRWAKDTLADVTAKIADLTAVIAEHQLVLADPARQREIYKREVLALKKLPSISR